MPDVWERTGLEPHASSTLDIATIAIVPDYRGDATEGVLTASMLQALGRFVRGLDLRWVVTIMDTAVLAHLQPLSCFFWHTYVGLEPMSYLDSPESIPVYGDLVEYFPRLERDDPGDVSHAVSRARARSDRGTAGLAGNDQRLDSRCRGNLTHHRLKATQGANAVCRPRPATVPARWFRCPSAPLCPSCLPHSLGVRSSSPAASWQPKPRSRSPCLTLSTPSATVVNPDCRA